MQVFKGIHMFGGVGADSNMYIIDGEILVDTGTGSAFINVKDEIEKLGFNPQKIKTIVNTHCHFDHTGGNKKFRDWLKAAIAVHNADKKSVESGDGTLAEMFGEMPHSTTVDRVLREGSVLQTKNFKFRVLSTPGHTPGSVCLYEEDKGILISGDMLFAENVGRIDLPGGDGRKLYESLEKLSELKINYLLPGHGETKIGGVSFLIKQMLQFYKNSTMSKTIFIKKQI